MDSALTPNRGEIGVAVHVGDLLRPPSIKYSSSSSVDISILII